ncbi:MAG: hemolysin family protein [Candidatus Zixiibacteriota bacterium]
MTGSIAVEVALIAALILLNGFFAGAEAALIAVRRSRVSELAARGGAAARALKRLKDAPDRFLATVQVGVTVVGTLASVVSGATVVDALAPRIALWPWEPAQRWAEQIAIGIVVVIIALATLVFGELVPKYLALARPERVALFASGPITWLSRLGYPVVTLLSSVSRGVTRLLGVHPSEQHRPVSDQEIRLLALEGSLHGSIDDVERELIHQALDFSDTTARQVMTPRPDIAAVNLADDVETVLQTIREEGYSRFPVYEETIDRIKGVIYTKDIIHILSERSPVILRDLVRPVLFVPDSMPIPTVLARFKAERRHLAVVLDEFGGTAGLLTLEDILEEIVGDIQDEYDTEPEAFRLLEDGTALALGGMAIIDFNERFGAQLPTDRGDTLAGLISSTLDRLPRKGDHIELADVRLDVATLDGRRIQLVRALRI